ncbi:MarR family winged helix-turn-helix transcriptional regulator [Saccharolobus caldissimus]|uniref:MarR family transcriptional regulator n=1 Tax=Saccharolobus caldissimus TaxID=1702097 RepID=A0AAQ4CNU1_9CREN|nr:MarR family winged helix-turn-helix transcriptional regulator [Saccharolobus caldissimus]BDB97472.1 MarR family transcriptional regulator [Saccharolobus caldissimus]
MRQREFLNPEQKILIALSDSQGMSVREIIERTKLGSKTVVDAVNYLVEIGLVKEEQQQEFPRKKIIRLTDKGKEISEYLKKIYDILNS